MNFVAKGLVCFSCGLVVGLDGRAAEAPRNEEVSGGLPHCLLIKQAIYPTSFVNPYMRLLDRDSYLDCQMMGRTDAPIDRQPLAYVINLSNKEHQNVKLQIVEDVMIYGRDRNDTYQALGPSFAQLWDGAIRDYISELTPVCLDLIGQTGNPDAASNLFSTLVRVIQHRLSQHPETQQYAQEQQVDYLRSIIDDALPTYARNISDELFGRMRTIFTKILDRHFAPRQNTSCE